jgi:LysM repeat protein
VAGRQPPGPARFVASVLALAVVVVAVPLGAVAVSRSRFGSTNPLSGVDPPWRWFGDRSTLTDPIPDDTVIDGLVRLSLCVVWVAVAVVVATTVVEVVHLVRHRGLPMPPVRGLGWAQRIARFIAVGLVVVLPVVSSAPSMGSMIPRVPAAESWEPATRTSVLPAGVPDDELDGDGATTAGQTRLSEAEAPDQPPTVPITGHVVQPGESIYSIAERLAGGDGAAVIDIAEAIVEANLGADMGPGRRFTNPAYIEVGWVLRIPSESAGRSSPLPTDDEPSAITYEVKPGDTLWDIADEQLGDPTEWSDIWNRNAGRSMADGRTFDDPDLILPGWEFELRDAEASAADPSPPIPIDDPAEPSDPADGAGSAEPVTEPTVTTTQPTVDAEPLPSFVDAPPTPTESTTASTTTSTAPPGISGDGDVADEHPPESPTAPAPIRLEHAALLAAGVLALVAVRRRQRLRAAGPRHRVPEPRPDLIATERRLRTIDAGERALRVDVACRAAAASLLGTGAQIGWVSVSPDGDVVLRLSDEAELPAPWSGDGQTWELGAEVPIELLAESARRVGMPCLAFVQLGVTDTGDDVLVDLEACGVLAVEAQPHQADEVVAGLAAGLASSMHAEVAHLIGVAVPTAALLGHRNAHVADSPAEAFELAAALVGTTAANERSSFELRSLRTGGEMWEPAVVLLGHAAGSSDMAEPWPPGGHGIGVVTCTRPGELRDAPVRLSALSDGWRLDGFGTSIEVTPIGLTTADLTDVDDILRAADRPLESIELAATDELRWADDDGDGAGTDGHVLRSSDLAGEATESGDGAAPFVGRDHRIVVGLLGAVEIRTHHGDRAEFARSKTAELIAWLATHRNRGTRSGARTALWELDVRDATFANVVSEARRGLARLVAPPEGEEWVARTLTDELPLHELVVTDSDLVEERLAHARLQPPQLAIETLRPAVELIRDMPFAGTSYLWPDAEGITSNLVLLAISAAGEFAGHALSLGDTEAVFWATGRGLRVLPGHEDLIGVRMRAHAHAGDLAGVRQEWESYERVLVADAWSDGEPAPKLLALRHELLSSN